MRDLTTADAAAAGEAKAAFHLRLRARGVRDLRVLRAFELIPRFDFVPAIHRDAAARDLAIPIGCGQTLQPAWLAARMVEALDVQAGHRVLEVGSGSGHTTAILAQLGAEALGVERFQNLAMTAQARLARFAIKNAVVMWGDGLALQSDVVGRFDRVLVHGLLETPDAFRPFLAPGGVLVCARTTDQGQAVVRTTLVDDMPVETRVCAACLQPMRPGLRGGG